mmetsp:Transcript_4007/g.7343  ORF Transcript_4007/g.7343 Transcript_4007/m.7343 type:complete len:329 (+) Transcript_4007:179-1165(+)
MPLSRPAKILNATEALYCCCVCRPSGWGLAIWSASSKLAILWRAPRPALLLAAPPTRGWCAISSPPSQRGRDWRCNRRSCPTRHAPTRTWISVCAGYTRRRSRTCSCAYFRRPSPRYFLFLGCPSTILSRIPCCPLNRRPRRLQHQRRRGEGLGEAQRAQVEHEATAATGPSREPPPAHFGREAQHLVGDVREVGLVAEEHFYLRWLRWRDEASHRVHVGPPLNTPLASGCLPQHLPPLVRPHLQQPSGVVDQAGLHSVQPLVIPHVALHFRRPLLPRSQRRRGILLELLVLALGLVPELHLQLCNVDLVVRYVPLLALSPNELLHQF